jgi:hypothetical protein
MKRKYVPPEMYESWGGEFNKKYEVYYQETWVLTKEAKEVGKCLHYRLFDSTEGVSQPGSWRIHGEQYPKHLEDYEVQLNKIDDRNMIVDQLTEDDDNILDI